MVPTWAPIEEHLVSPLLCARHPPPPLISGGLLLIFHISSVLSQYLLCQFSPGPRPAPDSDLYSQGHQIVLLSHLWVGLSQHYHVPGEQGLSQSRLWLVGTQQTLWPSTDICEMHAGLRVSPKRQRGGPRIPVLQTHTLFANSSQKHFWVDIGLLKPCVKRETSTQLLYDLPQ